MNKKNVIPRKLWILWYQGLSDAPLIVKRCIASWINKNPGWDVTILDNTNLNKYITLDLPEEKIAGLALAHQSDLVRLALLIEYGGVWADATTFCIFPLDDWIDDYGHSGFFVFSKPGQDRMISNWFIASEKGNLVVSKLYKLLASFWLDNNFKNPNKLRRKIIKTLSKRFNRSEETTKYWFSPVVTKILRVYPYCVFHYLFARLVASDSEAKIIWDNTYKSSADGPHLARHLGLFSPITDEIEKQIDSSPTPLYKLIWKYDHNPENSVLSYLMKRHSGEVETG
jgi:hypothetical protein